jgi:hypothetical protein
VSEFLDELDAAYRAEVDRFIDACRRDLVLRPALDPMLAALREYAEWLVWVAWNPANLAPLVGDDLGAPARRLAPALLAYAGLRLVDDGLDGHETYKGFKPTLLGWLRTRRPQPSVDVCAYSGFVGLCLFEFGVRRVDDVSGADAAREVATLFDGVAVGALAEPLVGLACDARTYEHIARRKSSAYNLILYKPLLDGVEPSPRRRLLSVLSEMDTLAQLVNDATDAGDDRERRQPNAAVQDLYPAGLSAELETRLALLWASACELPDAHRDALAAMFANLGTERVR